MLIRATAACVLARPVSLTRLVAGRTSIVKGEIYVSYKAYAFSYLTFTGTSWTLDPDLSNLPHRQQAHNNG
jgi:hypothetical protein